MVVEMDGEKVDVKARQTDGYVEIWSVDWWEWKRVA